MGIVARKRPVKPQTNNIVLPVTTKLLTLLSCITPGRESEQDLTLRLHNTSGTSEGNRTLAPRQSVKLASSATLDTAKSPKVEILTPHQATPPKVSIFSPVSSTHFHSSNFQILVVSPVTFQGNESFASLATAHIAWSPVVNKDDKTTSDTSVRVKIIKVKKRRKILLLVCSEKRFKKRLNKQ